MLKKTFTSLLTIIFACMVFWPIGVFAAPADEEEVIRVAWPELTVMSIVDEDGNYAGYDYEYLQKIAQYTGWKYEFVTFDDPDINVRLSKAFDMLEKGEVDIIGGTNKNESTEAVYDFPTYSYGTAYKTLIVPEESTAFYNINDLVQKSVRVAAYKNAQNNRAALQDFCDSNKIQLSFVDCETEDALLETVLTGKADAMLSNDLNPYRNMRTIVRFAGTQYFFGVTKGNVKVVNGLNTAIFDIHTASPYFETELYRKYFEEATDHAILSQQETTYVNQANALRVLVSPDAAPFQYLDDNGSLTGVTKDLLNTIAEQTGLSFEYILAGNHEEFRRILSEGDADLVAGIPYDYRFGDQYNTVFTDPYVTASMTLIARQGMENKPWDLSVLALPAGSYWANQVDFREAQTYDSVADCVDAVLTGKADYAYGNIYSIEYYTQKARQEIVSTPLPGQTMGVCIGAVRPADMNLISIINKVVRTVPENETTALLLRNSAQPERAVTLWTFVETNPIQSIVIVGSVLLVVILLIVVILYTRIRANKRLALDNQRYLELADISNEYLFEYDREKDVLSLSQKCADLLGSDRIITGLGERAAGSENYNALWHMLNGSGGNENEAYLRATDGNMRCYSVVKTTVASSGGARYVIGKLIDIQKEKLEKERLLEKSQKDGLTGLFNIESCKSQVTEYLLTKPETNVDAFLVCDIDHFKEVNDTFGHYNGDKVLMETADTLRALFRSSDIVARLGGDEFVVFMKDVKSVQVVTDKCARLCREFKRTLLIDGKERMLTISAGAAIAAGENHTYETLYRRADSALYKVKERGRDGFEVDQSL